MSGARTDTRRSAPSIFAAGVNFLMADGKQFAHPLYHLGKTERDLPVIAIDSFRHVSEQQLTVSIGMSCPRSATLARRVEDAAQCLTSCRCTCSPILTTSSKLAYSARCEALQQLYVFRTPGRLRQFVEDLHSGKLHREFHHGPDPSVSSAHYRRIVKLNSCVTTRRTPDCSARRRRPRPSSSSSSRPTRATPCSTATSSEATAARNAAAHQHSHTSTSRSTALFCILTSSLTPLPSHAPLLSLLSAALF